MKKRYIHTFSNFRTDKNIKPVMTVNEEFIGKLFKGLKNKISIGFSKMFGSAKKVEKLMDEYKSEILSSQEQKREAIKKYGEYINSEKDSKDDIDVDALKNNIKKATKNFEDEVRIIKKKFDIRFDEIVREESNKKIKSYISLKKLEMQQDVLRKETSSILNDTGLTEDMAKDDEFFKSMIDGIEEKISKNKESQSNRKKELEEISKDEAFDLKKAKELAENGEEYEWNGSPYLEKGFSKGDKIAYFSKGNKDKTNAIVISNKDGFVEIETEESKQDSKTFDIKKSSIIELVE
jgi:hypothetical protein